MNNMIRILTNLRGLNQRLIYGLSNNKNEDVYVPIRTLKAVRNTIFTVGDPQPISISSKILIFTPFLATALDGFINEWTNWRIAGSVIFLWLGFRIIKLLQFGRAHQVSALKVSKDLSKFYLTLPNNYYTSKMELILIQRQKKTVLQKFKEQLKNKTLEIPQKIYEALEKATGKQLEGHLQFLRKARNGVILQIDREDIESIKFISKSEMRKVIRQNMMSEAFRRAKRTSIFDQYTALNQDRNHILIVTKPFQKWNNHPIHFFIHFEANTDKKYQEYLKALAEGKKIQI